MELEDKIEELLRIYGQIFDLYSTGKDKEGEALIQEALEKSQDVEAYHLFFEGLIVKYKNEDYKLQEELLRKAVEMKPNDYFLISGLGVPLSNQGKDDEAIRCYDEALRINPEDYLALTNKGTTLSRQGKDDEAIRCYDEALKIKPDYYLALTNKGTTLSRQGKDDEAIRCYDEALRINPDDYRALTSKGTTLSKQGKDDEAIRCYDEALRINPNDYRALTSKGTTLSKQGRDDEAFELITAAYKIAPAGEHFTTKILKFICEKLGHDFNKVINEIEKNIAIGERSDKEEVSTLQVLIEKVREEFRTKIGVFKEQMKEFKANLDEFIATESLIDKKFPLLLTLRKWNSYTPIIPSEREDMIVGGEERSLGGGYFINYEGKGTVIDPGYNFIENFYRAGGRVIDIDNVVLTHAHNDHTIDFESIMTLIYKYNHNDERDFKTDDPKHKSITLYMNAGSFMKFSGLLDLRGCDYIKNVFMLTAGQTYDVDGITMTALQAYHDELITKSYSVGLHLKFVFKNNDKKCVKNIIFTSDTGLFPKIDKDTVNSKGKEIHTYYENAIKEEKVNLLVAHLGSIRPEEITEVSIYEENMDKVFYPNHLGLLGTARMITAIRPNLALVSEFGEELRQFRGELMDMLGKVVNQYFEDEGNKGITRLLPADLPLIYNIETEAIYCMVLDKMFDHKEISAKLSKQQSKNTFCYYYNDTTKKRIDTDTGLISFESRRKNGTLPYHI